MRRISRRFVLGGILAAVAGEVSAEAPERSLRPLARPAVVPAPIRPVAGAPAAGIATAGDLIAAARARSGRDATRAD